MTFGTSWKMKQTSIIQLENIERVTTIIFDIFEAHLTAISLRAFDEFRAFSCQNLPWMINIATIQAYLNSL